MRALLIVILAAVIGFFGYQMGVNGRTFNESVGVVTGATQAAEAAAAQAAAEAEAAAAEAAAQAEAEAKAAAEAAEAEAAAAEAAAAEAAAAEAAAQAEAEAQAAAEAEAAAAEAEAEAGAEVEAEAEVSAQDDPLAGAREFLTVDGFDADKLIEAIEGTELSAVQKTALTAAVNGAKDNPALLEATLTRIREALGQ